MWSDGNSVGSASVVIDGYVEGTLFFDNGRAEISAADDPSFPGFRILKLKSNDDSEEIQLQADFLNFISPSIAIAADQTGTALPCNISVFNANLVLGGDDQSGVGQTLLFGDGQLNTTFGWFDGGRYYGPDGTALLPTYSFKDDVNTGIYSGTNDQINFATNGVSRMLISTTAVQNDGYVSFSTNTRGPVLKSPNGHYWMQKVDNSGVVTTIDLGLTPP